MTRLNAKTLKEAIHGLEKAEEAVERAKEVYKEKYAEADRALEWDTQFELSPADRREVIELMLLERKSKL